MLPISAALRLPSALRCWKKAFSSAPLSTASTPLLTWVRRHTSCAASKTKHGSIFLHANDAQEDVGTNSMHLERYLYIWVRGVWPALPASLPRAISVSALSIMLAGQELHPGPVSTQQGAPGSIDDRAHAADQYGTRTHGAWLQCSVKCGLLQRPPPQALGSCLQGVIRRLQAANAAGSNNVVQCCCSNLQDPVQGIAHLPDDQHLCMGSGVSEPFNQIVTFGYHSAIMNKDCAYWYFAKRYSLQSPAYFDAAQYCVPTLAPLAHCHVESALLAPVICCVQERGVIPVEPRPLPLPCTPCLPRLAERCLVTRPHRMLHKPAAGLHDCRHHHFDEDAGQEAYLLEPFSRC